MSISLVRDEIFRFLRSDRAEALCIKGKWGVGKTYAWKSYLRDAGKSDAGISAERYAYVSLFGMNSLPELKYAIFEGTVTTNQIDQAPSFRTLQTAMESVEGVGRKYAWLLKAIPGQQDDFQGAAPALFLTVRNQIICIDDLERKGKGLDPTDVLGLISYLKEERGCKVALLLNDDALTDEDRDSFNTHLEKAVDKTLKFDPSPPEAVAIALKENDKVNELVSERCVALGISNIRVIKKIERAVRDLRGMVAEFDKEVFESATASLALFVWAKYQPKLAPSLKYLSTTLTSLQYPTANNEDLSPEEAAWSAILESYGYRVTDEFDLVLIEGVKNGFFDPDKIKHHAQIWHDQILAARGGSSFSAAWDLYHDSFDDNQEEVLDALYESFMRNYQHITPANLNGTVRLFKNLERAKQASDMIRHYVENREEDRSFYDLSQYPFSGDITDLDVKQAFSDKCAVFDEALDLNELLLNLKDNTSNDGVSALAKAPVDFYYRAFNENTGDDLRRMIAGALQFEKIVNATDEMKEVSNRAKEALTTIGSESPINNLRVARYGVTNRDQANPPDSD